MSDIYVIVADNDQPFNLPCREEPFIDDGGPLVFEQYTNSADLESIKARIAQLGGKYGKCRIARLVFLSEPEPPTRNEEEAMSTENQFMSVRSLLGNPQLSISEVEKVADAIKTLADIFELSYEEMAENFTGYLTEREYKRVCEELEI